MGEIADEMIEEMIFGDPNFEPDFDFPRARYPSFEQWRETFVWTDIDKVKHPLATIDDRYLSNIIPYLQRRYDTMLGGDDKRRVAKILEYLKKEQKHRVKHHIVTPTTKSSQPTMKLKERKHVR